jgi:hypothetical protein
VRDRYLRAVEHAGFREVAEREDDHAGRGVFGHDRDGEEQDPGQGGDTAGPAAADLFREAAGGRALARGLQHPEGVDAAPGAAAARGPGCCGYGGC